MIRSELIDVLAVRNPDLVASDAEAIVNAFFTAITEHLAGRGRVELRGFGAFTTRPREARTGRNPRTGEPVAVTAKSVVHFKPGKALRMLVNDGSPADGSGRF